MERVLTPEELLLRLVLLKKVFSLGRQRKSVRKKRLKDKIVVRREYRIMVEEKALMPDYIKFLSDIHK